MLLLFFIQYLADTSFQFSPEAMNQFTDELPQGLSFAHRIHMNTSPHGLIVFPILI
jgi:hypothetical protein